LPVNRDTDGTHEFTDEFPSRGISKFIELSALKDATAGWLANDVLVVKVEVTVQREDRFQVDTGAFGGLLPSRVPGMPCSSLCVPQVARLAT
jgi:hypothetical protein